MVWARFSDDWADQPTIVALTANAFRAYVESIVYVARYTTDGQVPADALRARDKRATPELVRAGLWEKTPGGIYAPLWREHVPPAADLAKARAITAERQRRRRGAP